MDITIKLKETLDKTEKMFESDPQVKSFEQTLQEFRKMVKSGIVKPRGYNIQTIDHKITAFQFNK